MSAAFLLSGFFAVFAPVPLLFALYAFGWVYALLALATNAAIIWLAGSAQVAQMYAILIAPLVFGFWAFATRPKIGVVAKVYLTWLLQAGVFVGALFIYAHVAKVSIVHEASDALGQFLDALKESASTRDQLLGGMDVDEWKRETLRTIPLSFSVTSLVLTFANYYLMVGLNPRGILSRVGLTRPALLEWRMPEWLVGGVIVLWLGALFGEHVKGGLLSLVCTDLLKFLAAGYGIQGVAILSARLDAWRVFGIFRSILFISVLLFLMPLVLSVGFFDQWFDFRVRFRQSNKD